MSISNQGKKSARFDERVWQALKMIPRGKVASYKEIAKFIGRPRAARAVGNACGRNPDAPGVPCHRAVRSDGRLGGYAGGVKKKIKLLKKEGVKAAGGRVKEFNGRQHRFGRKQKN